MSPPAHAGKSHPKFRPSEYTLRSIMVMRLAWFARRRGFESRWIENFGSIFALIYLKSGFTLNPTKSIRVCYLKSHVKFQIIKLLETSNMNAHNNINNMYHDKFQVISTEKGYFRIQACCTHIIRAISGLIFSSANSFTRQMICKKSILSTSRGRYKTDSPNFKGLSQLCLVWSQSVSQNFIMNIDITHERRWLGVRTAGLDFERSPVRIPVVAVYQWVFKKKLMYNKYRLLIRWRTTSWGNPHVRIKCVNARRTSMGCAPPITLSMNLLA